jgi:hypothetical protein
MGLALDRILCFLSTLCPSSGTANKPVRLHPDRLGRRDLQDLNLPPEIVGRILAQRDAEAARRRTHRI